MIHSLSQLMVLLSAMCGIPVVIAEVVEIPVKGVPWTEKSKTTQIQTTITFSSTHLSALSNSTGVALASKYDLTDIKARCPRVDTTLSRTGNIQTHSNDSCCLPCRHDSICRKIGNCCDKKFNEGGYMCHSPFVKHVGTSFHQMHFFMVDECLNGSEFPDSCATMDTTPWGSLYPVYDSISNLNYFNAHCAECNGASSYTYWDLRLDSHNVDWSVDHCLSMISGDLHDECTISFTPPKEMNVLNHVCTHDLIHSCNVTGQWPLYDSELDKACQKWFSPTLDGLGSIMYVNIYCAMCNDWVLRPCAQLSPDKLARRALSVLLDFRQVNNIITQQMNTHKEMFVNERCGRFMVRHPTKAECRIVLCQSGFIRSREECVPVSTNWRVYAYYVQIILTPVRAKLLPWSYLMKLTDVEHLSPEIWFNTTFTPLGHLKVYGKRVTFNDVPFVSEILVQAGRQISHFDLENEVNVLRKAMENIWTIELNRTVYSFSANFYRYAVYIQDGLHPRYDFISSLFRNKIYEARPPPKVYTYLNIKFPRGIKEKAVLKKTHFCEKVKLLRNEWIGGFQEIRLNVTAAHTDATVKSDEEATSLHEPLPSNGTGDISSNGSVSSIGPLSNNRSVLDNEPVSEHSRVLGDSEFDFYLDNKGEPVVEICVEDFNPDYRVQGTIISDPASKCSCAEHKIYHLLIFGLSLIAGKTFCD